MIARITSHQVHHEAQRHLEMGPDFYRDRVRYKVRSTEKMVAAIVFLSYRATVWSGWSVSEKDLELANELSRKLAERNVTDFVVVESREHSCEYDKTYRIDLWLATVATKTAMAG